ncbi:MAG: putative glycosyltransferase EpsF [Candidatus Dichloromethanomonas elyunquensis]|nr:MAG: putative glycosyltransferase EpsF [Candidatus Dichloromethanomonas elyunquensis]
MNKSTKKNNRDRPVRVAQIMGKHVTGGIKSVIMNYYKNIDRDVIQFDFFVDADSPLKNYSDIHELGGNVYEIPPVRVLWKYIPELRKILKREKYLIAHGYINTLNIFPMLAAMLAGVPVRIAENLSTAHPGEKKTILKNLLKPFSRFFATQLAANSNFSGEWLYGQNNLPKCLILRNAIDLDTFQYDPVLRLKTRKTFGLEDNFVIGHIGRYHYQKNHEFLIEIFKEVHQLDKSSRLMLIGYGELKDSILKKIEQLGLRNCVIDLGCREDIAQFYNAMDCFVLPSFYEGLPVVGIEAQASGLPCVMSAEITKETKITGLAEFVGLEKTAEVWARKIIKWKSFARQDVKEQAAASGYNIKEEAHKLERFYLDALDTSKGE